MVNTWICDREQIFDGERRPERLSANTRHVGTAMTPQQVRGLSETVDLPALHGYRAAVAAATQAAVVPGLPNLHAAERLLGEALAVRVQLGVALGL